MHFLPFREPASTWTHLVGLLLALPGTWLLWRRGGGEPGKRASLMVYGLGLILCYAASTLFHGVRLPADRLGPFARLDSVGIFALIAGTYTPLAWNLMPGPWRAWTLASVWCTAGVAIAWLASGRPFPPEAATSIYLLMGWGVVVCLGQIARVVPHRDLRIVVLGGISYSVGATLNVARWPALWPGRFGTHDLFHLFVIAGSLAHFWFILKVIAPGGRAG